MENIILIGFMGCGKSTIGRELAKTLGYPLLDTESTIEFKPLPEDDPKVRKPDISRARDLLGWEPKVPFEEGIVETIEFFRKKTEN